MMAGYGEGPHKHSPAHGLGGYGWGEAVPGSLPDPQEVKFVTRQSTATEWVWFLLQKKAPSTVGGLGGVANVAGAEVTPQG